MTNIFDELAAEVAELTEIPNDEKMERLSKSCRELAEADIEVEALEKKLSEAKERRMTLQHKTLPAIFESLNMDHFGLQPTDDAPGYDFEMRPYFKASIPEDSEEEFKQAAFAHLEALGGGDIIRTQVTYTLGKAQVDLARTISAFISLLAERMAVAGVSDIPQPSIKMGVPWNTLTAFLKEAWGRQQQLTLDEDGNLPEGETPIDLVKLNATVGQVVKIKERK